MNQYLKKAMAALMIVLMCSGMLAGCVENKDSELPEKESTNTTEANSDATIKATKTNKDKKSSATDTKAIEKEIFKKVNAERKKAGKSQLKWNDTLYKAAAVRAKEITTKFSHTRPNNKSCFTAITQAGISYKSAAENIASGQTTADQVMKAWMKSSGHKKNILSNNKDFACAVIENPKGGKYKGYAYVQLFCVPK